MKRTLVRAIVSESAQSGGKEGERQSASLSPSLAKPAVRAAPKAQVRQVRARQVGTLRGSLDLFSTLL